MFELDDETDMKELEEKAMDDPDVHQCRVAVRYVCGVEVERDYEEAFDWLEIAVKNNQPCAQFRLGRAYLIRLGVDRDLFEAAIWFFAAVAQGVDAAFLFCNASERNERSYSMTLRSFTAARQACGARRNPHGNKSRFGQRLEADSFNAKSGVIRTKVSLKNRS